MSLDPIKVADTCSWFRKARDDIRAAELLMSGPLVDEVSFHCQQSVEKCLKGFRFWHGLPFRNIHDLNLLSQDCIAIDPSLHSVLTATASLTPYAVEYRYPGPLVHPTEEEARDLINLAKKIDAEITGRLPFSVT